MTLIMGPLELMRWRSETKHRKLLEARKAAEAADPSLKVVVEKPTTVWDGAEYENNNKSTALMAPADYEKNEHRMKSMKTEKLSARHFSSSCAVELELFKVCVKDRFHTGNTAAQCKVLQEDFRRCNNA
jgi:hypothetical protein